MLGLSVAGSYLCETRKREGMTQASNVLFTIVRRAAKSVMLPKKNRLSQRPSDENLYADHNKSGYSPSIRRPFTYRARLDAVYFPIP